MGIPERRSREKEYRLQLILEAAENLIKDKGFNNFTLSKLSEKIEFSRGIIYYYFKNEENIMAKIIVNKMIKLLDRLNRIPEQKNGFDEMQSINREFQDFLEAEPQYLSFITYFITGKIQHAKKEAVPYYSDYETLRDVIFTKCVNAVDRGVKDGSIYPEIDPHVIAYCIWAGIGSFWEYMIRDSLARPVNGEIINNPEIFINAFFEIFYRGLKNK